MKKRKISLKSFLIAFAAAIMVITAAFFIYVSDYYRADAQAIQAIDQSGEQSGNRGYTVFYPNKNSDIKIGLIFYPGGKVEDKAYAPLLMSLLQKGVTCVLVKMPFNLAVFDINAADKIYGSFPEIKSWYIGGHSLGGAMASSYAEKNAVKLKGLVLLAAYPVNAMPIPTLTIYGSNDGVLNRSKLQNTGKTLMIEGGNHAYFGNYGEQKGDGKALISREKQQEEAINYIISFIRN
jgi:dienelactone hydrolase